MADSEPGYEVARSELRASHEDRDQVVELLRVSAGDGRLIRAPWGPDVPEVPRIEVSGRVGSGHFVARPQYRTFWQRLTRQPPYEIAGH